MKIFAVLGICVALLVAPACDKKSGEGRQSPEQLKEAAAKLKAPELMKRVPADAVFVFANYQRLDDNFVSKIADYAAMGIEASKGKLAKESLEASDFMAKHGDVLTMAGLKKIGIHTSPYFAVYNQGLSLIARLELVDGEALFAFVNKMIAEYGEDEDLVQPKTLGDAHYWEWQKKKVVVIIGIRKKELVFAVIPTALKSELLPYALGDKLPKKNIVDSGALKKVVSSRGGAKGVGYFNVEAAVASLVKGNDLLAGSKADLTGLSATCKEEVLSISKIVPKIVFGYDRLDTSEISMYGGIELRKDIAKSVAGLASPSPGYTYANKSKSFASLGMGFNSHKMVTFLKDLASKLASSPYQCEMLNSLNLAAAEAATELDLVPGVVEDILGYILILDRFDAENPRASTGLVALQSSDLNPLLMLAKNFLPGFKNLKLEVGGEPTKIELDSFGLKMDIYAARSKEMVGFAVGDSKAKLKELLASKAPKQGPFIFFKMAVGEIAKLPNKSNPDKKIAKQVKEVLKKLDTFRYEFEADDTGIFMRASLTLR